MKIWAVGSSGWIGSACCAELEDHDIIRAGPSVDVRSGSKLAYNLGSHRVEALVYAVGENYLEQSWKLDWAKTLDLYDVNVVGLLRCLMIATTVEKCVVIGSDAATRPMRTSVAYNASKAALNAAVKCIARERANELQINVVAPGLIAGGGMTDYVYDRTQELRPELDLNSYMRNQIPMDRPGYATEVAAVVRWLIEDAPPYLNGAIIEVNGAR